MPADLRVLDPHTFGVLQLCDAPAIAPPPELLRDESVNRRRYPGEGELPLDDILDALPENVVIEIEIPTVEHASASIVERATLCAQRSRSFLDRYYARRSAT
jgi:sugar phosphate isomerase/epimerase